MTRMGIGASIRIAKSSLSSVASFKMWERKDVYLPESAICIPPARFLLCVFVEEKDLVNGMSFRGLLVSMMM